ncbi:hypothetical protein Acr_00g0066380 [Actinidia rufa]|uniref:Uncharacterized protein n=1 Tax=Actinidia rufa TaxID=165716 RepID=A0A7J0DQM0_9ERIC|nr:hypothetical protein Acr_00g0066380 [Actinidia rufa]
MPPRNARGRAKSLTGARGARETCGTHRNHDEEDDGNHQESVMGGGASAPKKNMGGAPPMVLGGAEFMQGVFTAIEQVVRNIVQTMQMSVRTAESRATTAMKAFLQLRLPTFKGELDPLVVKDWFEQVIRALDTILVTEEDLRVLFTSYQLQGPSNGGRPWRKCAVEGEQSGNYGIATIYSISSGLEGHYSIYISIDFILVQTIGYSSAGSEGAGTDFCYNINSETIGDSRIVGVAIGYLYCARD